MSRTEAIAQFNQALKLGKKYYNSCVSQGLYPFPQVLEDILENQSTAGNINLGLIDIPMDRIVGTYASGRKMAFAGNFMPLLEMNTEFGHKWIDLCVAHLDESGITDPIQAYEYLGQFYVQEGHKRVSVLKSFDAPSIAGQVIRVVPAPSQDPEIQKYYEFMQFYKMSQLYQVTFTQPGSYARLQAALGFAPDQVWTEDARRGFSNDFRRFTNAFAQLNGEKLPVTPGDALLVYLQVHPFSELRGMTTDAIRVALSALWPDVRLLAQGEPISVSTEPEPAEKSILTRIFGAPKPHVAFIYDFDPQKSAWASAHEQGQKYLEEKLGEQIEISSHLCGASADETIEQAITNGANVIFATSPTLIDACRRAAALHKNVAVYNCSLSMPYAGVRSYYGRVYEGKFITGAIAGAMADGNRIGYIANYPIMGSSAGINAFALGAKLTNPRVRIDLKWSCLPGNPVQEFKDAGISVISNRDADGAKPFLAWDLGTYQVNPGGTMTPLASPRWKWGKFYEKTVRSLMAGGIDAVRDSNHAINDWWGLSTGMIDVDLDAQLPASMKQLARILKQGIVKEEIDPFFCPIWDQNGNMISDGSRQFTLEERMRMDWLCDNVEGRIPAFEELLPQSQNLVRLLGLYRENIPPKTEEAAL
ncbi:MAG: BMP family ABC transporter substrate-binding protein [Clostridia bacterium]|nr:BMP family ABC transporter substrate-binding protein [Clostridia bacterium]